MASPGSKQMNKPTNKSINKAKEVAGEKIIKTFRPTWEAHWSSLGSGGRGRTNQNIEPKGGALVF